MAPGTVAHLGILGEDAVDKTIEEPMFGLDREFPCQLYQLSIDLCIEKGFLGTLKPYFNLEDVKNLQERIGDMPIPARAHLVREPGGKLRWVTMEPPEVNLLCQPLARMLGSLLGYLPTTFSAFNRSWKSWDFADMLSIKEGPDPDDYDVSVFDLVSASDNLDRVFSRDCCEGVLKAALGTGQIWAYVKIVLNVIFRNRHIFIYKDKFKDVILHNFIATNGLLMGNSATKECLVLVSEMVLRRSRMTSSDLRRNSFLWFVAGDDIAIYATKQFFQLVITVYQSVNGVIKVEKTFSNKIWVPFCQGGLFLEGITKHHSKRLEKVGYDQHICVDIVMSRLLVPYGVESMDSNPTARNPVIGKGAALKKLLDYYPRKERNPMIIRMFHRNMGSSIPKDPLSYLPGTLGGYDLPHLIPKEVLLSKIQQRVPNVIYPLFGMLITGERNPLWLLNLMRRARTGVSARGLEHATFDPLIRQYEQALLTSGSRYLTLEELTDKTREFFISKGRPVSAITPLDVRKTARVLGYLSGQDLAAVVDRSTALRVFFLVAAGKIPLADAVPGRGQVMTPSEILENFVELELPFRVHSDSEKRNSLLESFSPGKSMEGYKAFCDWFNGGMRRISEDIGWIFLPRGSYVDSTNGMRIPIWEPRKPDEPPVKGSLRDPYVEVEQDIYIGSVISLNRLYLNADKI